MFNINELSRQQRVGYNMLHRSTLTQRDEYLGSVVSYETNRLHKAVKVYETNDLSGGQCKFRIEGDYRRAKSVLDRLNINTLTWMNEAQEYYDTKLVQAVAKLESFGFLSDDIALDIEHTDLNSNAGLEFYISGRNRRTGLSIGRVFARLVWVNCYEKRSHYRWIVTLKGAKAASQEEIVEVDAIETPSPRTATGRLVQVEALLEAGQSTKQIAATLEMNISYVRKLVRALKNNVVAKY